MSDAQQQHQKAPMISVVLLTSMMALPTVSIALKLRDRLELDGQIAFITLLVYNLLMTLHSNNRRSTLAVVRLLVTYARG
jgi:hypothetical protein